MRFGLDNRPKRMCTIFCYLPMEIVEISKLQLLIQPEHAVSAASTALTDKRLSRVVRDYDRIPPQPIAYLRMSRIGFSFFREYLGKLYR